MEESKEKHIQDISPILGTYSDFVVLKNNEIVSIIKVDGVNLDLLDNYEQTTLFDDYAAFLMGMSNIDIQTVTTTIPLNMKQFNMGWKQHYLDVKRRYEEMKSIDNEKEVEATKNLLQLIASRCLEYQNIELSADITTQEHLIVVKQKIANKTIKSLARAENELREMTTKITNSLNDIFERYGVNIEVLSARENITILHRFIDFKYSLYS